jgi:hypothetical protein
MSIIGIIIVSVFGALILVSAVSWLRTREDGQFEATFSTLMITGILLTLYLDLRP